MAKQHVRNGRLGRIARQERAGIDFGEGLRAVPLAAIDRRPRQWWDPATRQWLREG